MTYKDWKEFLSDLIEDKYMKLTAQILFAAIAIFLIVIMIDFHWNAHTGKHVKIWVFEEGSDTVIKPKPQIIYKVKHDTIHDKGSKNFNNKIDKVNTLNQN